MADDKLKAGPESPGEGSVGDAQTVTRPPAPEAVEGPAAGTGPVRQPEQSVTPGMGGDVPTQPTPQVEADKVEKSPDQDKKVEPEEKTANAGAVPPRSRVLPRGTNRKRGRGPAQAARPRLIRRPVTSPRPQLWTKCPEVRNKSLPPPSAEEKHAGNAIKM